MAISKKQRFEAFKRDGFACQYCGRKPPEVTLELDHINPRARQGKDDIENLITACFDCNRGKGKIPLEKIPNTLIIKLKVLEEKELQLKEYNKFLSRIEKRIQIEIEEIDLVYRSYFSGWQLSDRFKNISLKRFFKSLPKQIIIEAMHSACNCMLRKPENDDNSGEAINYFCGICWNKIREKE